MGGGAAAAPEWTGIDKVVRGYFPKDEDSELFFPFFADEIMCSIWFGLLLLRLKLQFASLLIFFPWDRSHHSFFIPPPTTDITKLTI